MTGIYILLDDKKRGLPIKTFYNLDKTIFEKANLDGYGVYFAVNEFNVSDEQMTAIGVKTKRHNDLCTRLRYVYADLDIGKAGDGQSREDKENKKKTVVDALMSKCPPTFIIDTSNGVQPLWQIDTEPTEENKKLYIQTIKGVIEWSKQYGCMADNVHDLARILRLPGYYHQKEEPYLCKIIQKTDKKYDLFPLSCEFPYTEEVKEQKHPATQSSSPIYQAIDSLDFQELIIRAFASVRRKCEFDKTGRVILDDRQTGTFQGRKDDRQYLASSSHEPFKGNKITAVADILQITNKEAFKWIIKEYRLEHSELEKQQIINPKKELPKKDFKERYTWGTRGLDTTFAIIKRQNLIVLGAKRGLGKTTFTFDMAVKNAVKGHKVLYVSLEMSKEAIKDDFARKYAGWTVEEEYDYKVPETKKQSYERRLKEIDEIPNLIFEGMRRGANTKWIDVLNLINKYQGLDLIFIDNLDKIAGEEREENNEKQKRIIADLMGFTEERQIPIILIHHHRKSGTVGKKDYGMDELSGSGKVADGADIVVKVSYEPKDTYPEKYATRITIQKARGYPLAMRTIYFIRGTFVDVAPSEDDFYGRVPMSHYETEKDLQLTEEIFKNI